MTRIKYGKIPLPGNKHIITIRYSGFSAPPSVTCTIQDTYKLGATAMLRNVTATQATCFCFYNGGEELYDGIVNWIAVGPTNEVRTCTHLHPGGTHVCHPDVYCE